MTADDRKRGLRRIESEALGPNSSQPRSNSLNLIFIACSFGFPALWIHVSTFPHWISCDVAGCLMATFSTVFCPGAFSVKPQFLNCAIAITAASYNVLATTSTLWRTLFVSVNETRQVRAVGTDRLYIYSEQKANTARSPPQCLGEPLLPRLGLRLPERMGYNSCSASA